jgi:hypothetical protein
MAANRREESLCESASDLLSKGTEPNRIAKNAGGNQFAWQEARSRQFVESRIRQIKRFRRSDRSMEASCTYVRLDATRYFVAVKGMQ